MSAVNAPLLALNAGEISTMALGRVDLSKMRMAMEVQENLLPKVLGPAEFRPGTEYLGSTKGNLPARLIPFVYNSANVADIELTNGYMRVLLSGGPLTRASVTAPVTNSGFATDLTGWTDIDEEGAGSVWDAGYLLLTGTGFNYAGRRQEVATANPNVEHALRLVIARGNVVLRIGTTAGGDNLLAATTLVSGQHSIAFTPTGSSFWIDLRSITDIPSLVDNVSVEAAGAVEIPTGWDDIAVKRVRYDQSGDVLFCAAGTQQKRIERRSQRSWSIVDYLTDDGPFLSANLTATTIKASSPFGNTLLTASRPLFTPNHNGALFRLTTSGQSASANLAGEEQWTETIRVTGVSSDGSGSRVFGLSLVGTWTGTVWLQRSLAEPGAWVDVLSYTSALSGIHDDLLDNQIAYYRFGFKGGDYTSGVVSAALTYSGGVQTGIVRTDLYVSPTQIYGNFLRPISRTTATPDWAESAWSSVRGWPTSVAFHDGRLWWGKADTLFGSVSDAFHSFDADTKGDSGPIQRSIATGGVEGINWMLSLQRLIAGTAMQEVSIRSSSFDEPLTPSAFTARNCSTRGSADIAAVRLDTSGIFVQRDGTHVFELAYDVQGQDYSAGNLTRINDEICGAGVVAMAIQRQPDTRIWCVLADGSCAVLVREKADEVTAWVPVTTDGDFEDVSVTPGDPEDDVKFVVRRVINGVEKRYIERLRSASECQGGTLSRNVDCHVTYSGSSTTTLTGLAHLEGEGVAVWGNGRTIVSGRAPVVVSGGSITLPAAVTSAVIGLPYKWQLKTTKLAYGVRQGATALLQRKRVDHVGFLAAHFGWAGVRFGNALGDTGGMRNLSSIYKGRTLSADETIEHYDYDASGFQGGWSTDSRVCAEGISPYPATLIGLVIGMQTNERGIGGNPSPPGEEG